MIIEIGFLTWWHGPQVSVGVVLGGKEKLLVVSAQTHTHTHTHTWHSKEEGVMLPKEKVKEWAVDSHY